MVYELDKANARWLDSIVGTPGAQLSVGANPEYRGKSGFIGPLGLSPVDEGPNTS